MLVGFPGGSVRKNSPDSAGPAGDTGPAPGLRGSPGGETGTYSSTLAGIIPWTETGRVSGVAKSQTWLSMHARNVVVSCRGRIFYSPMTRSQLFY